MKKKYTFISFALAGFFFILGKLIDSSIFGSDIFNYPNGIMYNELHLNLYIPIFFILAGLLIMVGLFNNYFVLIDNKKELLLKAEKETLEKELLLKVEKETLEKELLLKAEKETMEKNQEEFKSNGFEGRVIEGLEKITNEAGESLIKAGDKFIASIVVTIITIIVIVLMLTADRPDFKSSGVLFIVGALISFIIQISAINEIRSAGKSLKSTK